MLILVAALIGSVVWYMFVYDRETVQEILVNQGRRSADRGDYKTAAWFYDLSYELGREDEDVAIELAQIYKDAGNYTKAEYTLTNAIADGGTAKLYAALCRTYVEQDKLLDAVTMLDNVSDPVLKAELDAMRPAAPQTDVAPGFYNQYITLSILYEGETLYATTDGEYPSTSAEPSTGSITLESGSTKIYALSMNSDGLVSPLSIFNYTVGGVVEEVVLEDPAIDAQVRQLLMFGSSTSIFTSDLWTITDFTVPAEAESLEDLALLSRLTRLTIRDRDIPSLQFLAGMTSLEELVISGCHIRGGLETVASLPSLRKLTLSDCGLSTVAVLEPARFLTHLDLSNNAIGNLEPLAGMTGLEVLNLSENAVSDLSVLSGLPMLTKLNLSRNSVSSIAPLVACASMTELDISYNTVSDLGALGNMHRLTSFLAASNQIDNISALAACVKLRELDLSDNAVTDLSAISAMAELTTLNFSRNAVTALPELPEGCPLQTIWGEYNQLTDVSALGKLEQLNYVYLDYNPELADISFLVNCHQLVQVNVYGTVVPANSVNELLDRSVIVNFDPTA
ncbi:MAG: leucine-rich repeat domain-containing protein [Oscillospiraceae bacterium]|nr:leucine-rich repeat domain-containing protein [Oscillospiraceae bacterium]